MQFKHYANLYSELMIVGKMKTIHEFSGAQDLPTDIHAAAVRGNLKGVKYFVDSGQDIHCKNEDGESLLHAAAQGSNVELFTYLTSLGLNPRDVDKDGWSVLHVACRYDRYEIIKYLCHSHPDLKTQLTKTKSSPLHVCAEYGSVDVFQFLVEQDLEVFATNRGGNTVLHAAAEGGNYNMVEYIMTKYPQLIMNKDKKGYSALHSCAQNCDNIDVFRFMINHGFNVFGVSYRNVNVLHLAALGGQYEIVKFLVTAYPQLKKTVSVIKSTALHFSARGGNIEVFRLLVDEGFNVKEVAKYDHNVLHTACISGRHDMVNYIVSNYPDLATATTADGKTPLLLAAEKEHDAIISCLLDHKVDPYQSMTAAANFHKASVSNKGSPYLMKFIFDKYMGKIADGTAQKETTPTGRGVLPIKEIESLKWSGDEKNESILTGIDHMWCGYQATKPSKPVLVAVMNENGVEKKEVFDTFEVVCRKSSCVSREAKEIADLEIAKGIVFTSEEAERVQKCLTKNSKRLMKQHSNLQIVSGSKFKSKRYGFEDARVVDQVCIVLYVHIKGVIPLTEEPFPDMIDGIPIDVREGMFQVQSNPLEYHEKLMMGCQIGSAYGTCGTLGGFVQLSDGNIACLTCWHVFCTNASRTDRGSSPLHSEDFIREAFQPGASNQSCRFGSVTAGHMEPGDENSVGVDVALIEITDRQRQPTSGQFPNAINDISGFQPGKPMVYTSGKVVKGFHEVPRTQNVVKYGCKTQLTVGMIRLSGPAVYQRKVTFRTSPDPSDEYEMYQQLEIFPPKGTIFSDFGDSGSLVFTVSDKGRGDLDITALGLLVGKTSYDSSIVTPIWAILNKLGLPLKLLEFPGFSATSGSQTDPIEMPTASSRLSVLETDVDTMKTDIVSLQENIRTLDDNVRRKIDDSIRDQQQLYENVRDRIDENVKDQQHLFDYLRERIEESARGQQQTSKDVREQIDEKVQKMDQNMQRQMQEQMKAIEKIGEKIDQSNFSCTIL